MLFYMGVLMLMFGDSICSALGVVVPQQLKDLQENKFMYSIIAFFVISQVLSSLRSSGAFEIKINDELVYSKLETGKHIDQVRLQEIFEPYGVNFMV